MRSVSEAVNRGESVHDALLEAEGFFPSLFVELVEVGEQTGQLSETLVRLAEHYEGQVRLGRDFRLMLIWPMLELTVALLVVGVLIWFQGLMRARGAPIDMLGFGLSGNEGLTVYLLTLAAIAAGILFVLHSVKRGALGPGRWHGSCFFFPESARRCGRFVWRGSPGRCT